MTAGNASSGSRERFVRAPFTWAAYGLVGYFAYLETVLGPLMPFLRAEHGFSYTVASLHFSAFASGGVLMGLFGDQVTGRWGRRASIWGGGAVMVPGGILLALSPVAIGTIFGALVMGLSGSLILITSQAILADKHGKWSAVAITESNALASACAIGASLAVGAFSGWGLGWRAALVPPVAALILLAVRFRTAPLGHSSKHHADPDGKSSPLSARFWVYWSVLVMGVAVEWCVVYWAADFLENAAGLNRATAAASLSIFLFAMLLGRLLGGRLARRMTGASLLLLTLGVALVGFPLFWLLEAPALNLLGLFVTGLGVGSVYPLTISVAVASSAGDSDKATARLAFGGAGAILLAPFALGALADRLGIETAYGIVVPLLLAALALTLVARRMDSKETKRDVKEE